jgi:hypothetical protein
MSVTHIVPDSATTPRHLAANASSDAPEPGDQLPLTTCPDTRSLAATPPLPPAPPAPAGEAFPSLEALRLPQSFSQLQVKVVTTHIPVTKPNKQWFVRAHRELAIAVAVLELKEEREIYLIVPELRELLAKECQARLLVPSITRQGVLFLWPLRMPGDDGKLDTWSTSAHEAMARAKDVWIRMESNMALGAYQWTEAAVDLGEPTWPALDLMTMLKVGFKGRLISSLDHPVLRKLRGEV